MYTIYNQAADQAYGTEAKANLIRQANPGGEGPLIIPDDPSAPTDKPHEIPATDPDEVALLIDGTRYRYWSAMSIERTLDSIDTIDIKAPFDADVPDFRGAFQPFSYKAMSVMVGGSTLFTGTMVNVDPTMTENETTVTVSGYAKCGVLADVNPPASALPLEFNKVTLETIATQLCEPFGVSVEFVDSAGDPFERVACDPSRKILEFLIELAQQRGLIMSNDSEGGLVFGKPTYDEPPVAILAQGQSPVTSVTPRFSPQNYFSHITGLESSEAGKKGGQFTVKNPHVTEGVRPLNFSVTDTDGPNVQVATEAKAGRMIGNMAAYTVELSTWRDSAGNLWQPGTLVTLTAPDAMIYNEYKFIIRAVTLDRDRESSTATLELAMPSAFSGVIPETLPWAES